MFKGRNDLKLSENGGKKATFVQDQKETVDISGTHKTGDPVYGQNSMFVLLCDFAFYKY